MKVFTTTHTLKYGQAYLWFNVCKTKKRINNEEENKKQIKEECKRSTFVRNAICTSQSHHYSQGGGKVLNTLCVTSTLCQIYGVVPTTTLRHTQNSVHSTMPCCFNLVAIQLTVKVMLNHALKISQGCKQSRFVIPPVLTH